MPFIVPCDLFNCSVPSSLCSLSTIYSETSEIGPDSAADFYDHCHMQFSLGPFLSISAASEVIVSVIGPAVGLIGVQK
jgi:hypothetical protein